MAVAIGLTLASLGYQRVGATQRVEGEGFCPSAVPCEVPALGGGMPFPFLVDEPEWSVPGAIHLGEDDFRWGPFAVDLTFWLVFVLGAARFAPWTPPERRSAGPGSIPAA